jgi:DNA-binding transcriptional LysR family regulator
MELPSIDLNLLVSLHALLTERNVTRAGERVGLSQPAMSAALGKLRRHFGDELLTRDGQRFILTPLATSLLDQADMALRYVEHTFAARPVFDAESSTREFALVMSDYALTVLGGPLLGLLERRAPNVKLRISPIDVATVDYASSALRTVDLMVLPRGFLHDLPSTELYRDRWVCVTAIDNDNVGEVVTEEGLRTMRWILIFNRPTQFTPADHHLQLAGFERHVDVVIENFIALPFLLAGTRRIGILQERLARKLQTSAGVRIVELEAELPELVEAIWWHPSRASDPGHRWLQTLLIDAAATLHEPVAEPTH